MPGLGASFGRGAATSYQQDLANSDAILLPEILNRLPVPKAQKRWLTLAAGFISLAGGYALWMSFVAAGRPSALNPDDARLATGEKGGTQ